MRTVLTAAEFEAAQKAIATAALAALQGNGFMKSCPVPVNVAVKLLVAVRSSGYCAPGERDSCCSAYGTLGGSSFCTPVRVHSNVLLVACVHQPTSTFARSSKQRQRQPIKLLPF